MRGIILAVMLVAASPAIAGMDIAPYEFTADNGTVVQAEWGKFEVPLRHEVKNGKTITLSFVRFKSTNPHPGYPIVYLAGGPGGSGMSAARGRRFPLFMALRKVADVIVLDQRGTGASNSIPHCATKPFPRSTPYTRATMAEYYGSTIKHCMAFWRKKGVDIVAYNTRENALDLETLRKTLGTKKLNLWGISYGSTLALAALKLMPEHIDRVVLASPLGMNQTFRLPARTQDFLQRVDALLKSDPKLKKVYPDLLGTMKTVLDGLAQKPVKVTLQPSSDGKPVTLTIGKFPIQIVSDHLLKDPDMLRYLPIAYYAMAAGHFRPILKSSYGERWTASVTGMTLGVRAQSCLSPEREKLIERQAKTALLGNALNFFTYIKRRSASIKPLDGDFCKPVHSDVPTLVLTGTLDGRTYPAGHVEILNGLSNGQEVVIVNAGHDLFMSSPKVTTDIVDFLSHRPAPYTKIRVPPPVFITPAMMQARVAHKH